MTDRSDRLFLALAVLGIPYAIAATRLLEPVVSAGALNIATALLAVSAPTILGSLGALVSTPRR